MTYDYYYFTNLYTKQQCEEILLFAEQNISNNYEDVAPNFKNVEVKCIETPVIKHLLEKFFSKVYETNNKYYGFSLFSKKPQSINLNIYDVNSSYNTHKDKTSNGCMSDIKFTAILNLSNEPYTGGEFEFSFNEYVRVSEIDNTGSLLIFPSFYYHRVKPVTSGKRISLSAWFEGPNWK